MYKINAILLLLCNAVFAQTNTGAKSPAMIRYPKETRLANVKQLTFGGDNAEAYFSSDGKKIVFQATNPEWQTQCDQIYYSTLDNFSPSIVSTGSGRTTCSYFLPGDTAVLFASTHMAGEKCPPKPAPREDHKYVWPVYESYDIFISDLQGNILKQLTRSPGYDAEATVSPKGDKIVFTSSRSGDLELYTMNLDGSNVKQITDQLGYDGGAFFSPDGKKIIFRASRPKTDEQIKTYKELLAQNLVMPTEMELFICNADGSNMKQITNLGGANWAPNFTADGQKIIFSSNHNAKGFHFNLFLCNLDGTGIQQITYDAKFDAFPVFSRSGKKLMWSSMRNNGGSHDINIFIADWK
jgi:TolB protein